MKKNSRFIAFSGLIAAIYALVTVLPGLIFPALFPLSFGPVQVRIAEAMTVLPFLFPEAIWGLFIGCMVANIIGGLGPVDIFGGSAITLVAALLTFQLGKFKISWLAPIPPVVLNAVGVGYYLYFLGLRIPFLDTNSVWFHMLFVGIGQAIACFGLGLPLLHLIKKRRLT